MFQKVKSYVAILVTLLAINLGLSVKAEAAEGLAVTKTSIVLESYEFGPAVTKSHFLNLIRVTPERLSHSSTQVTTAGVSRQVTNSYVSDDKGHVVYYDNSKYVTLDWTYHLIIINMGGMLNLYIFNLSLGPINGWKVIWYQ